MCAQMFNLFNSLKLEFKISIALYKKMCHYLDRIMYSKYGEDIHLKNVSFY